MAAARMVIRRLNMRFASYAGIDTFPGIRLAGLEVGRRRCVVAIPIFDSPVFDFQKSQQTAIGTVPEMMAPGFDVIAWLDIVGSDPDSLEAGAAGCFESPHLGLTLGILDLDIDPGMRHDQMDLLDHTFDVHKRVLVISMGMVRPSG